MLLRVCTLKLWSVTLYVSCEFVTESWSVAVTEIEWTIRRGRITKVLLKNWPDCNNTVPTDDIYQVSGMTMKTYFHSGINVAKTRDVEIFTNTCNQPNFSNVVLWCLQIIVHTWKCEPCGSFATNYSYHYYYRNVFTCIGHCPPSLRTSASKFGTLYSVQCCIGLCVLNTNFSWNCVGTALDINNNN